MLTNYRRNRRTNAHLSMLSTVTRIRVTDLIQVVRGGYPELQGTWVHLRVAIDLRQWLSVEFQVWVTGIIDDWHQTQKLLRQVPVDWTKQFPDRLFEHIHRLHGWAPFNRSVNSPQIVGHYINDLVWDRLAPGLRQAIEIRIPRYPSGAHKERMHQMLVDVVGIAALQQHIGILIVLMDRQATWGGFMFAVDQVLPKARRRIPLLPQQPQGAQLPLNLIP